MKKLISLPFSLSPSSSLFFLFSLSPFFSPLSPLFSFPTAWKNCLYWQQFCAVGVSIRCLSGLVHFLRRKDVDEDPAQCVYQAVDCVTLRQLIWPRKGAIRIWEDKGIDNLIVAPHCSTTSFSYQLLHHTMTSRSTVCCDQIRRLWRTRCYFSHATKLSWWSITMMTAC